MKRPAECPRLVWWGVCVMGVVCDICYCLTPKRKQQLEQWKALESGEFAAIIRERSRPLTLEEAEAMRWILDDEPTKGRDLLKQEAEDRTKNS